MFCNGAIFHTWEQWEPYERKMTTTNWTHGKQNIGLSYTEHWQKRKCLVCSIEQRLPIHKDKG
jgi:hypothetical protein